MWNSLCQVCVYRPCLCQVCVVYRQQFVSSLFVYRQQFVSSLFVYRPCLVCVQTLSFVYRHCLVCVQTLSVSSLCCVQTLSCLCTDLVQNLAQARTQLSCSKVHSSALRNLEHCITPSLGSPLAQPLPSLPASLGTTGFKGAVYIQIIRSSKSLCAITEA